MILTMSAATSADRLIFVDRMMAKSWLSGPAKIFDKLACSALDIAEASWVIVSYPVTEVAETFAYSSMGQLTIGFLEASLDTTANILEKVLPVENTKKHKLLHKESLGQASLAEIAHARTEAAIAEKKRAKNTHLMRALTTGSTYLVVQLRHQKIWLRSFKLDPNDDLCGHCAKRRKVVAPRRLGGLSGLMRLSMGAVAAPLHMVGMHVNWNDSTLDVTVSGNEAIDKSPVRPKSVTEKRKFPMLDSSSDEEEEAVHTFHDDLNDYKSDEDADYKPNDDESSCSDEYAEGETESDVSIGKSPSPLMARKAKKSAKKLTTNGQQTNQLGKKQDDKQAATVQVGQVNGAGKKKDDGNQKGGADMKKGRSPKKSPSKSRSYSPAINGQDASKNLEMGGADPSLQKLILGK